MRDFSVIVIVRVTVMVSVTCSKKYLRNCLNSKHVSNAAIAGGPVQNYHRIQSDLFLLLIWLQLRKVDHFTFWLHVKWMEIAVFCQSSDVVSMLLYGSTAHIITVIELVLANVILFQHILILLSTDLYLRIIAAYCYCRKKQ